MKDSAVRWRRGWCAPTGKSVGFFFGFCADDADGRGDESRQNEGRRRGGDGLNRTTKFSISLFVSFQQRKKKQKTKERNFSLSHSPAVHGRVFLFPLFSVVFLFAFSIVVRFGNRRQKNQIVSSCVLRSAPIRLPTGRTVHSVVISLIAPSYNYVSDDSLEVSYSLLLVGSNRHRYVDKCLPPILVPRCRRLWLTFIDWYGRPWPPLFFPIEIQRRVFLF